MAIDPDETTNPKLPFTLPRQVWFGVFGAILLLAFGWVVMHSGPFAPIKVTVTQVARGTVAPSLFGIGTVEARRAYLIGPTTAGRVRSVRVDVGDLVTAGQLLAEMDPVDLDKRVASTAAAVGRGQGAVVTAQAQVRDARSRQVLAAIEAQRTVELGQKGLVSTSAVDTASQQQQSADAQLAAAESALASARQELTRLEAERGAAQEQRASIRLLAPVDGLVTAREAEPGSTVISGQPVLRLQDLGSLWITVRLEQGRSAGLREGLPAAITLRSDPGRTLAGKVVRVEPVSDSVTEERLAQVGLDTLPPGVTSNEMAEVTLQLPRVTGALIIPNASLHRRGAQAGVWLRADGRLRFAPVRIGATGLDGSVEIIEGLKAGDEVVVHSERELKDRSRVKVVDTLAGAAR